MEHLLAQAIAGLFFDLALFLYCYVHLTKPVREMLGNISRVQHFITTAGGVEQYRSSCRSDEQSLFHLNAQEGLLAFKDRTGFRSRVLRWVVHHPRVSELVLVCLFTAVWSLSIGIRDSIGMMAAIWFFVSVLSRVTAPVALSRKLGSDEKDSQEA